MKISTFLQPIYTMQLHPGYFRKKKKTSWLIFSISLFMTSHIRSKSRLLVRYTSSVVVCRIQPKFLFYFLVHLQACQPDWIIRLILISTIFRTICKGILELESLDWHAGIPCFWWMHLVQVLQVVIIHLCMYVAILVGFCLTPWFDTWFTSSTIYYFRV